MDRLFELGISDSDLRFMLEQVPNIIDMTNEEISEKIDILTYVGCNEKHIKNIIVSNPGYLDRITDDVLKLISYLKKIGLSDINFLFDSNPYFLNYDVFELEEYIICQIDKGKNIVDIIEGIESNPYVIDEE